MRPDFVDNLYLGIVLAVVVFLTGWCAAHSLGLSPHLMPALPVLSLLACG